MTGSCATWDDDLHGETSGSDRNSSRWHRRAPERSSLHRQDSNVSVLMQRRRFCADMVVETQIHGHLDLVTAILARPDMTDFVVAHVCRRLWRDQQVIAFAARGARLSVPVVNMTTSLMFLNGVGT
jgi:hypothetical protein